MSIILGLAGSRERRCRRSHDRDSNGGLESTFRLLQMRFVEEQSNW